MLERIVTALILVTIVLSCMFLTASIYPMLILMILAALGAGYEWFKMMPESVSGGQGIKQKAWLCGVVTAIAAWGILTYFSMVWPLLWLISIVIWGFNISWVLRYPDYDGWYNSKLMGMGLLFILAALSAIFDVWHHSPWWLMYVFLLVWGADTGAYFVGRKFGMRKLAPAVSPNKSIEGLFGGLALSCLIIIVVSALYLKLAFLPFLCFLILSLLTVLISVFGDLFESMIKRRAGIKDSGRILPGHGGILDRVDSLLPALPLFAAGLYLFDLFGFGL